MLTSLMSNFYLQSETLISYYASKSFTFFFKNVENLSVQMIITYFYRFVELLHNLSIYPQVTEKYKEPLVGNPS